MRWTSLGNVVVVAATLFAEDMKISGAEDGEDGDGSKNDPHRVLLFWDTHNAI
jgi:hypothetical protein